MTGQAIERHQAGGEVTEQRWSHFQRMANVIATSGVLGQGFKDNPAAVMAVELTLDQLGLPVTLPNMARFDFYEGQVRPRVSLLMDFARLHGHHVWQPDDECDGDRAVCYGQRRGEEQVHRVTVTRGQFGHLQGKNNWKQYGPDMLKWRAAARLLRTVMGDTMLGLAPEVVETLNSGAVAPAAPPGVDAITGEVLPVLDVPDDDAPEDFDPADDAEHSEVDPDAALRNDRTAVQAKINQVPAERRADLAAAWREAGLPRVHDLAPEQLGPAESVVGLFLEPPAADAPEWGPGEEPFE